MAALSWLRNRLTRLRRLSVSWTRVHAWLLRRSNGRLRFGALFAGRLPVLALTTTGRKSGQRRSSVVAYLREGDSYAVVASNAGADRPPAWWLNLQASPDAEIHAGGSHVLVRARPATAAEQERLWHRFNEENASFEAYRGYTDRDLPVVILDPR
jgi:F420H(2)-dependent quinone reductase